MNGIQKRIAVLINQHGSLRAAARVLEIDHAYLQRLLTSSKTNPSKAMLKKLKLKQIVSWEPTP